MKASLNYYSSPSGSMLDESLGKCIRYYFIFVLAVKKRKTKKKIATLNIQVAQVHKSVDSHFLSKRK